MPSGRSVFAWALAAPVAGWAAVRGLGLERGYSLVALMAFTPVAAMVAWVAVAAAAVARQWTAVAVAAASAVVLAAAVAPRWLSSGDPPGRGTDLRVLTANVRYGTADPAALVELVRAHRVDVLAVQELRPAFARALRTEGLGELLPHAVLDPLPRSAGSGLYSRLRLERVPGPGGMLMAHPAARADLGAGGQVEVVSVHPPHPTRRQLARWRADLRRLPGPDAGAVPRILAGDFNATLDHAELRRLLDRGYADAAALTGNGLETTWPAGRRFPPEVTVDHVLIPRAHASVSSSAILPLRGSDHRAVLAEISLASSRQVRVAAGRRWILARCGSSTPGRTSSRG